MLTNVTKPCRCIITAYKKLVIKHYKFFKILFIPKIELLVRL